MSVIRDESVGGDNRFTGVSPNWDVELGNAGARRPYSKTKTIVDRVLAAILLVPVLPITGLLVLLVRLTSRGPGIYRQIRVGKNGRLFRIYKIRTMRHDAEASTGATWTQVNDTRITRLGRVLRKLHLDEFPQLFNVIRGEMSLVGPRPERPEFVQVLAKRIPGYLKRLAVPPGMTGLAQINLPANTNVESVQPKLVLDLEYIQHAGPLLDTRIFLCTVAHLLGVRGKYVTSVFGLRRDVTLPAYLGPSTGGDGSHASSAAQANILQMAVSEQTDGDGTVAKYGRVRSQGKTDGRLRPKPK